VTGIGPGAWKPATRRTIESHNLYGQIVGELGTMGLLAFLGIVVCFCLNLRAIRKAYRAHPDWGKDFLYHVTGAMGLALVLLLFEGNFGHNLFRFTWLWYGGFLVIARYCIDQRLCGATTEARTLMNQNPAYGFGWGYTYG
jgi:hypothetical protein